MGYFSHKEDKIESLQENVNNIEQSIALGELSQSQKMFSQLWFLGYK